jgi:hypothetical protein
VWLRKNLNRPARLKVRGAGELCLIDLFLYERQARRAALGQSPGDALRGVEPTFKPATGWPDALPGGSW